jgi:hypothetical protein
LISKADFIASIMYMKFLNLKSNFSVPAAREARLHISCEENCLILSLGPQRIPFDHCMQKLCHNGRKLEKTTEVALEKTASVGFKGKKNKYHVRWAKLCCKKFRLSKGFKFIFNRNKCKYASEPAVVAPRQAWREKQECYDNCIAFSNSYNTPGCYSKCYN